MKKLFFMAAVIAAFAGVSCEETHSGMIWDKPYVEFYEESIIVEPEGGEMVIPVLSTGVDNVHIEFQSGDSWEIDPENGDKTPMEGWIKIIQRVPYLSGIRALALLLSQTHQVVMSARRGLLFRVSLRMIQ